MAGVSAATWAAAASLAALAAASPDGGPAESAEAAIEVEVGREALACPCALPALVCDDPVVEPAFTDAGTVLRGVRPGKTLCAGRDGAGVAVPRRPAFPLIPRDRLGYLTRHMEEP